MNVWRLDLPLPPDATLEREALLWDLAGQEDYRLIHQLFLEETALALLLINPQKDDPFAEAGDWLKALKTAANSPEAKRDAARLLIFSQIDVGGMKLGNAKIERFREQHGFAGWLPTSAKTGENCSDQENRRPALEAETAHRREHSVGQAAVDEHAAPAGRAEERRDGDARQDGHPAAALLRAGAAAGAGAAGREHSASPTCAPR